MADFASKKITSNGKDFYPASDVLPQKENDDFCTEKR